MLEQLSDKRDSEATNTFYCTKKIMETSELHVGFESIKKEFWLKVAFYILILHHF